MKRISLLLCLTLLAGCASDGAAPSEEPVRRYLYVASPGIRNYVRWGGKGVLVYDIDAGHKLLRRIESPFDDINGRVENVKGICANARTRKLYVTALSRIACIDLMTGKTVWVRKLEGGCDRMAITPDGKAIYVPSLEKEHWHVIDGETGEVIRKLVTNQGSHNTVCPPDGSRVYLAGLKSPWLIVADPRTHAIEKKVGPFSHSIRPFTISSARQLAVVNVNRLLGFEIGDLRTGKMLYRIEVPGFKTGKVKRHGCPSHGVGLTPDEKEVWVVDAFNQSLHVFDFTVLPPKYVQTIPLKVDQPGWITFTIDGTLAYPSTGEIIDTKTRRIVAHLKDEKGDPVQSEKVVEVHWQGGVPVRVGDQFGVGRVTP